MEINEYQQLAMRTSNKVLTQYEHLLNGALGLAGESGEVADLLKKNRMQGHPLDFVHVAKELGDICWYVAETASAIGYDLETILQMNVEKLKARYPEGFSAERSLHRQEGDVQMQHHKPTQNEMILDYMDEFGSISPLEAIRDLSVLRLASRISDLKKMGFPIVTEKETAKNRWGKPCSYARYSLGDWNG